MDQEIVRIPSQSCHHICTRMDRTVPSINEYSAHSFPKTVGEEPEMLIKSCCADHDNHDSHAAVQLSAENSRDGEGGEGGPSSGHPLAGIPSGIKIPLQIESAMTVQQLLQVQ